MLFTFKKTIGDTEFTFQEESANMKEFFQKASFISSLPSVGPNGETDLILRHRITAKGDYYSIVSEKAKQEFSIGQSKDNVTLFGKDWQALYDAGAAQGNVSAPTAGLGQTQPTPLQQTNTNVQNGPAQIVPPVNQPVQQPIQTAPVQQPIQQAPVQQPAPVATPAQQTAVNNVAAKYGL